MCAEGHDGCDGYDGTLPLTGKGTDSPDLTFQRCSGDDAHIERDRSRTSRGWAAMNAMEMKPHERHNASSDERAIAHGACGQKHLPTGRGCIRVANHGGSCDFRPPDEFEAVADGHAKPLVG